MVIPDLLMLDTSPIIVIVHPADKEVPPLTIDLGFGESLVKRSGFIVETLIQNVMQRDIVATGLGWTMLDWN